APSAGIGLGEPTFADLPEVEGDTVHLDVVDRWGNLVSATPSGGWLQSSPAVGGLGFSVTTRGQMFWLDPGLPGALGPGRRPRTTLTPTLITRDGQPYLGIGTPGGDQQEQWSLSTFLRIFQQRLGLQAAIDAPQFHTAHYISSFFPRGFAPGVLHIEDRFPEATRQALAARGHVLAEQPGWSLGRVCAAGFSDGMVRAAATPRYMQAYAVGR
ncbi:MAG: gamma-glutamyltransferase, partial [Pseudomonadota bacterium]